MKLFFICRASTEIGLGHLIRSRTLAETASRRHTVTFLVIGSDIAGRLLSDVSFRFHIAPDDQAISLYLNENHDVIVCDMMNLEDSWLEYLKQKATLLASISPIFNQMNRMDLFFSRTKYGLDDYELDGVKQFTGLDYMIIQKSCISINSASFKSNLKRENLPVAICMGGGDAANKTLHFLDALRNCKVPTTFWVLIGEGYIHSLDQLTRTINRDKNHEVILAKTNVSMWHILNNCVLALLSGGVTTYEAAFAGLPTINLFDSADQFFLIRELVEAGVSVNAGLINSKNMERLSTLVKDLYTDRGALLEMHMKSRRLIDGKGSDRIMAIMEYELTAVQQGGAGLPTGEI